MYWDAGAGSWIDGPGKDTNGQARQKLVTPTSPDAYPFNVTIWSTSETGLRSVGWRTDPRIQTIEVDLIDFIVEPDPGHVLIEQQLGFTAVDYNTARRGHLAGGWRSDRPERRLHRGQGTGDLHRET